MRRLLKVQFERTIQHRTHPSKYIEFSMGMRPTLAGLHCACVCVCLLACAVINFKHYNITKIELKHSVGEGLFPECNGAETTEVEACMATYSLFVCPATDYQ